MSEFAYRTHHPVLGPVRNPVNLGRASGGSSSGSAAAVAAGFAPAALGTDTGGSIRVPAAYCGIVGLIGSANLVDTSGIMSLSTTLDRIGVLTGSVSDAALILEHMVGRRLGLIDRESLEVIRPEPSSLRIAIEVDYFTSRAQAKVIERWKDAVRALESAGCRVEVIQLPDAAVWRKAQRTILLFEAWRGHRIRLEAGASYGPVFRASVTSGARISIRRYELALERISQARRIMAKAFSKADVLITPTSPTVPPPFEEGRYRFRFTRYTTLATVAGLPAISVPAGFGAFGLPVGVQLIAGMGEERKMLGIAALLEKLLTGLPEARIADK